MSPPVERRSSRPRIGAASVTGDTPKFQPSAEGWQLIEQAWGCDFNDHDRSKICEIVDRFLDWHRFEKAAPFVDNVNFHIDQLEKAARQLNRAFSAVLGGSRDGGDAAFQAQLAIEQAWRGVDLLGSQKLNVFYSMTCGLVSACMRSRKEFEHNATVWEGQAWELMTCRLAEFAARRRLSITVRKDTDKRADQKHSPLVVFVKAIQDQFPAEVPIRFSTENSLATQISGVLRRARKNGIEFRRDPPKQIPLTG
jgi:hypothetical protein